MFSPTGNMNKIKKGKRTNEKIPTATDMCGVDDCS